MADLSDIQAAQTVKLIGSDATGVEQTPVQSTAQGALHLNLRNSSGTELGITGNPLRIDPVGTTPQPASQSGTWTVQPGNVANTTPWLASIAWGGSSAVVTPITVDIDSAALAVRPIPYEPPTFTGIAEGVIVGNNKSLIAIQNTGTSVIKIKEVWLINDRTAALTGVAASFRLVRITSFTGGTAIVPGSYDTNDSLPTGITMSTGATVAGSSTVYRTVDWSTDEWSTGTLDQEGYDHGVQYSRPFFETLDNSKSIVLRQNQGLHLVCATNTTNGQFNLRIIFTVE